jgi:type II secretory ATPase GspE/PulE/Tfp pilus assembly ATPase PilB-like protein
MAVPADALANIQLFKALSRPQLEEVAQLVQPEERERDEVILTEGSPHEALYIIKEGRVGVVMPHPKYKVTMMAEELVKGDSFGLVSLTTGAPIEATFCALTRTSLYRLERKDFTPASKRLPGLIAGVARALAARMARERGRADVSFVSLGGRQLDRRLWALAPENLLIANRMVPIDLTGKTLTIGMVDPEDVGALRDLASVLNGFTIKLVAVSAPDMERFIAAGFGKKRHRTAVVSAHERPAVNFFDDDINQEKAPAIASHIVNLANEVVSTALALGASDIHLETESKGAVVRYRVDGQLRQRPELIPLENVRPLISRFKLLSRMDITETRRPRDGRISVSVGKRIVDLRVSTVPAKFGEKVVIRILDAASNISNLRNIIAVDPVREVFSEMLARPHGLILVTGPTGSGKTTTLYTALAERKRPEINVVTVEDPIEYHLDGVTQVQTNADIGIGFDSLLRGILRQDPDVIMIGETRDRETARIAVEASMTGHLVLTSVHTNSAIDAIMRLVDLGAERYSIATGLMAVVHQRLVRRLCQSCKEPCDYPKPIMDRLQQAGVLQDSGTVLLRGVGCEICHGTGFRGRTGVFELLNVNEAVKVAIASGADPSRLREVAIQNHALYDIPRYARIMLARGDTTPSEILHLAEQGVVTSEAFGGVDRQSTSDASSTSWNMPSISAQNAVIERPPQLPRISAAPLSMNRSQAPASASSLAPSASDVVPRMSGSPAASPLPAAPSASMPVSIPAATRIETAPARIPRSPLPTPLPPMSAPPPISTANPKAKATTAEAQPPRKSEVKDDSPPPILDPDFFE